MKAFSRQSRSDRNRTGVRQECQVQKIGEPVTVGPTRRAGGLVVGIGSALGQVGVPISFGSMCPAGFGGLVNQAGRRRGQVGRQGGLRWWMG